MSALTAAQHPAAADLPQLLKRLEAATAKLEELALAHQGGPHGPSTSAAQNQPGRPLGGSASATTCGPVNAGGGASSAAVNAYESLLAGPLKTFLNLSRDIGEIIEEQSRAVGAAFEAERRIIETAGNCKKPDLTSSEFAELIKPVQEASLAAVSLKENNRQSPFFNHLSTVSEGLPALGWVAVEPKPFPFVGEMRDAAQFYANRVIKEYKDKDRKHVDWANSYINLLSELQGYVKAHHTTGLVWNSKGGDLKSAAATTAPARSQAPAAAAPPPSQASPTGSLFSELNRGGNITAHLKHVDKSQMTHKNPELRASSVVKAEAGKPAAAPSFAKGPAKLPPRTQQEGNKWVVENHVDARVTLDNVELKHVVYIYGCTGTTVQIKGKVNTVSIDNCKKTGVLVDSTVAGVDLVNCKSVQVQITGLSPKVSVDKTDGCQIFMSSQCVREQMELFTAKSSEINLSFPESDSQGSEFVERAVPEQLKTVVTDGKLHTVCVEHKG